MVTSSNFTRVSGAVQVSDGVNQPDVTVLNVDIVDVNDHSPSFELPPDMSECLGFNCTVRRGPTVPENVSPGTVLYSFGASDADYGGNGQISFQTSASDEFGLTCDNSAGLFTIQQLGTPSSDGLYRGNLTVAEGRQLDYESQPT